LSIRAITCRAAAERRWSTSPSFSRSTSPFPIPQDELTKIRDAQAKAPLDVHALSLDGKQLTDGKLSSISNQVAAATGTVALYATFANPGEVLWPGQFVMAELVLGIRRNAVTAPVESVMSAPGGDYVYVIGQDDTVRRVPVLVVDRQNGLAFVEKGLSPGEQTVTNGQYRLANNIKVAIQNPAKPTGPPKS
jgi:membrane fusion protein, multidrug efflux system